MSEKTEKLEKAISQIDDYTRDQMSKIANRLDDLQMTYDTRLLAAMLAGRAGMLYGKLIYSKVETQETARKIWKQAGDPIENVPVSDVKVVKIADNSVLETKN